MRKEDGVPAEETDIRRRITRFFASRTGIILVGLVIGVVAAASLLFVVHRYRSLS